MTDILEWDIYEVNSDSFRLTQNRVRGRLRKFALTKGLNLLTENTEKGEPRLRFALLSGTDPKHIKMFLSELFMDVRIDLIREKIKNPVLSKLQVNNEDRYNI